MASMAPTSGPNNAGGSNLSVDRLLDEMNDLHIRDDKEVEATVIDGNETETGHIIVTTIGGRNGQPKQYVPETVHRVIKHYNKMNQRTPLIYVKIYLYQICRALAYIHCSIGVCHRDIKPQNLLCMNSKHKSLIFSVHSLDEQVMSDLYAPNASLPNNGRYLPPLFNFKPHELKGVPVELVAKLIPEHARKQCTFLGL